MKRWKCRDCCCIVRTESQPNFCCECGSKNVVQYEQAKFQDKDAHLRAVVAVMNEHYDKLEPLKKTYYEIMQYFRTQLHRGNMTQDEYDSRAGMYHGYKPRGMSKR